MKTYLAPANANIVEMFENESDKVALINNVAEAMQKVLEALGINTECDPNTCETADRVAKMLVNELCAGKYTERPKMTDFPNSACYDQLYTVGPITIKSLCSHHFLPFVGKAWVGILPFAPDFPQRPTPPQGDDFDLLAYIRKYSDDQDQNQKIQDVLGRMSSKDKMDMGRNLNQARQVYIDAMKKWSQAVNSQAATVLGLSKFARLADWVFCRPQIQEEATQMLADEIERETHAAGIGLIVKAKHMCTGIRGVEQPEMMMTTGVMRGALRQYPAIKQEFMAMIDLGV